MQSQEFSNQPPSTITYAIPRRHRKISLVLGICLVIIALASIIVGGCGFIDYYWWVNGSVYTGHDIWIGVFVSYSNNLCC